MKCITQHLVVAGCLTVLNATVNAQSSQSSAQPVPQPTGVPVPASRPAPRQVEVEAQVIELEHSQSLKLLGIEPPEGDGTRSGTLRHNGSISHNIFHKKLTELVKSKRARVLNPPRMVAINTLSSTTIRVKTIPMPSGIGRITLTSSDRSEDGAAQPGNPVPGATTDGGEALFLNANAREDDIVSLTVRSGHNIRLDPWKSNRFVSLYVPTPLEQTLQMRDGETVVLGNFAPEVVEGTAPQARATTTPRAVNRTTKAVVILLTARIIHRAEETKSVPVVYAPSPEWLEAIRREAQKREQEDKK